MSAKKTTSSDANVQATRKAYEKIHKEYVSSNRLLNDDVRRNADKFMSFLSGREILDVGCAGGRETAYFANNNLMASGCDLSPAFIKLATKTYPQCRFFEADMRHLKGEALFDGIWCNAAFLHIPKQDAHSTLKAFYGLLRPKGILYVSVMGGSFEGMRENKQMEWPERHFSEYTQDELDKEMTGAGFTKFGYSSNQTDWGPVFLHSFYRKA